MQTRLRYYSCASGAEDNGMEQMVQKIKELKNEVDDLSRIVFLSKKARTSAGWLSGIFKDSGVKKLRRYANQPNNDVSVFFETQDTYESIAGEVVVACGLNSDEILLLEDKSSIKAIIALPRPEHKIDKWAKITNAVNIDNNTHAAPFALPTCVVIRALETLTNAIDMSTGISHSSDERLAKTYLRVCEKYEVPLEEEEIESYLIKQLHWKKIFANDLLALIHKINIGESFEGGGRTKLFYHIQRWEEECMDKTYH